MQDILLFIQNHLALSSLLAVLLVVLIVLEFMKLRQSASRLSPAQAVYWMNHNKAVVVDVRTQDAFVAGHIVGAVSLPVADLNNKLKKIEKFKSQPLIITCAAGADASKAAAVLQQQGFQTQILHGGLRAWRDAGMPLVKG